jgi:hypothetical protein
MLDLLDPQVEETPMHTFPCSGKAVLTDRRLDERLKSLDNNHPNAD